MATDSIGVNRPAIMREIPYIAFLPSFLRKRPAFFCFISGKIKFAEYHDNCQLHGDIYMALFSTPGDQIVNENRHGNLIMEAPHNAIFASIDVRR